MSPETIAGVRRSTRGVLLERVGEQRRIQAEVGRAVVLVEIHVAPPAVVGRQVEDGVDPLERLRGDGRIPKVTFDQIHVTGVQLLLGVVPLPCAALESAPSWKR